MSQITPILSNNSGSAFVPPLPPYPVERQTGAPSHIRRQPEMSLSSPSTAEGCESIARSILSPAKDTTTVTTRTTPQPVPGSAFRKLLPGSTSTLQPPANSNPMPPSSTNTVSDPVVPPAAPKPYSKRITNFNQRPKTEWLPALRKVVTTATLGVEPSVSREERAKIVGGHINELLSLIDKVSQRGPETADLKQAQDTVIFHGEMLKRAREIAKNYSNTTAIAKCWGMQAYHNETTPGDVAQACALLEKLQELDAKEGNTKLSDSYARLSRTARRRLARKKSTLGEVVEELRNNITAATSHNNTPHAPKQISPQKAPKPTAPVRNGPVSTAPRPLQPSNNSTPPQHPLIAPRPLTTASLPDSNRRQQHLAAMTSPQSPLPRTPSAPQPIPLSPFPPLPRTPSAPQPVPVAATGIELSTSPRPAKRPRIEKQVVVPPPPIVTEDSRSPPLLDETTAMVREGPMMALVREADAPATKPQESEEVSKKFYLDIEKGLRKIHGKLVDEASEHTLSPEMFKKLMDRINRMGKELQELGPK